MSSERERDRAQRETQTQTQTERERERKYAGAAVAELQQKIRAEIHRQSLQVLLFPCLLGVGSAVDQIELSQLVSSCVNAQKRKEKKRKVRICSIANRRRRRLLVVPGTERQRPGWDLQLLTAHNRLANLFCWAPPAS